MTEKNKIEDNNIYTHSYTSTVTTAATCIATGIRTYTCTCGDTYTEDIPVDSSNHVNTMNVAATASTCDVNGYTAGVYCNDCKQYISGHAERPLAAHQTVLQNEIKPDCTHAGYTGDEYCTVCKQVIVKGDYVDELGHIDTNNDGKCDRCGTQLTEPEKDLNIFQRIIQWFRNLFARLFRR